MEYAYTVLLLDETGEEINETNITAILEAAGVDVVESRVKALVAALEDVDLDAATADGNLDAATADGEHDAATDDSDHDAAAEDEKGADDFEAADDTGTVIEDRERRVPAIPATAGDGEDGEGGEQETELEADPADQEQRGDA